MTAVLASPAQTITAIAALQGQDLLRIAREAGKIRRGQETLDKGWAARTLRAASPEVANASSDVRVVPLRRDRRTKELYPKSALALCSIDTARIRDTPFAESTLCEALNDLVLTAREDEANSGYRRRSRLLGVARFSLAESSFLYRAVERDYELVRDAIERGVELNGTLGELVQPRTKGSGGDAPRTFAFYARPAFISRMLGLGA